VFVTGAVKMLRWRAEALDLSPWGFDSKRFAEGGEGVVYPSAHIYLMSRSRFPTRIPALLFQYKSKSKENLYYNLEFGKILYKKSSTKYLDLEQFYLVTTIIKEKEAITR
jgi:hypothetical protein